MFASVSTAADDGFWCSLGELILAVYPLTPHYGPLKTVTKPLPTPLGQLSS